MCILYRGRIAIHRRPPHVRSGAGVVRGGGSPSSWAMDVCRWGCRAAGSDGANELDRLSYTNLRAPLVGDRQSTGMLCIALPIDHSSLPEMNSRAVRRLDVECYSVRRRPWCPAPARLRGPPEVGAGSLRFCWVSPVWIVCFGLPAMFGSVFLRRHLCRQKSPCMTRRFQLHVLPLRQPFCISVLLRTKRFVTKRF